MTAGPGASIGRVDLHTHSTASDGGLTPAELAAAAREAGLVGLALTDHDTVDGLAEFLAAGRAEGLESVGGVELSLEHPATMHLLGLNAAGESEIPAALDRLKAFRAERNRRMFDRLRGLGYELSWENLLERSGGGQLGRPHFAAQLVEQGSFETPDEVYEKLLGKGRPGYVDKVRLSPAEGLALIRRAGWAPVLAHPVSLNLAPHQWPPLLGRLAEEGLLGLEVRHPSHDPDQQAFFQGLADRFGLVPTAGSDFHGRYKPAIGLDWVRTGSPFGLEMLERLRERQRWRR